jgi:hypothetical protein
LYSSSASFCASACSSAFSSPTITGFNGRVSLGFTGCLALSLSLSLSLSPLPVVDCPGLPLGGPPADGR